ncbi:MAG: 2-polyprenyl-3-methyl-6-methoxy-1,4-benzoquinone monooxygenase [Rhodanobacteraceae bacterium]|nr:2-polyprenyl-3-methyl-6-methoxy-1,4-benzoquinone monooxygenase [Rhodanobacteraceae bacterium]
MFTRHYSLLDRCLDQIERALGASLDVRAEAVRPNPAGDQPEAELNEEQRRHAAGLMRINHTGEVCAQALYLGQAAVARDAGTRTQLLAAAQEEADHLSWCQERLQELDSRGSVLNPLWYTGAYVMGLAAGLRGDGWNLGFVVETERQVEAHLDAHLDHDGLPQQDLRSRAIVAVMKDDEARHADHAQAAGARPLPRPIPDLMRLAAATMKTVAYRL